MDLFRHALDANDQFPPANLSDGCRFSKQTFAGVRGNDEVAPTPVVRGIESVRQGTTTF